MRLRIRFNNLTGTCRLEIAASFPHFRFALGIDVCFFASRTFRAKRNAEASRTRIRRGGRWIVQNRILSLIGAEALHHLDQKTPTQRSHSDLSGMVELRLLTEKLSSKSDR